MVNMLGREATEGRIRLVVGLVICSILPQQARADHPGLYEYDVLRDGGPIGYHSVLVASSDDQLVLDVETNINVKLGFLTVFRFEHRRREVWKSGRLMEAASRTIRDGKQFDISVRTDGDRYVRVVNGREDELNDRIQPLVYWNSDALDQKTFFSLIDDRLLNVSFEHRGHQVIDWANGPLITDHYKMTGDEEREIWYDGQGHVVRMKLRRLGSDVEFLMRIQAPDEAPNDGAVSRTNRTHQE